MGFWKVVLSQNRVFPVGARRKRGLVFLDQSEFPLGGTTGRAMFRQPFLTVDQLPAFGTTPHQFGRLQNRVVFEVIEDLNLGNGLGMGGHEAPLSLVVSLNVMIKRGRKKGWPG